MAPTWTRAASGEKAEADVDRCGLCPQQAVTAWWLAEWQLERYLCHHHSTARQDAMTGAGWVLMVDDREHVGA